MKVLILAALPLLALGSSNSTDPAEKAKVLVCTLTNEKVTSCCCEKRNGKLYCTKAKKEVNECCCKSTDSEKKSQ
ncbi:hypothetical protein L0222_19820 [bacterium]|nr:hypothetical protein [bacterium]MCI0601558.1 hypothetical protein [bacterium]